MMGRIHRSNAGAHNEGALICQQAAPGLELIIGGLRDPTFGPVVMIGSGGIFTEVLRDVAFRLAPMAPLKKGSRETQKFNIIGKTQPRSETCTKRTKSTSSRC
jgi:hypothetical protein